MPIRSVDGTNIPRSNLLGSVRKKPRVHSKNYIYKTKEAKTTGMEFALLSLISFNGSGYADLEDTDSFFESYYAYKTMKRRKDHIEIVKAYQPDLTPHIDKLLGTTSGAGRLPSKYNITRFAAFYPPAKNWED